ncbi:Regulator_of chromosome condensation 1/beta-lactamase-inhibitor protein II [Hexamita inflata]|uniref:Regulator of chromosome condensation 1/beta-lactamase-inhibitor protein II n=1 Tax=Hexamita inflata TaxID=28002 RepID=A0AA86P274_9EUKA|nr:Regulator of chromosome condensation 1/beta-lactamase-inhibitor protein II [Hexamita inflata]
MFVVVSLQQAFMQQFIFPHGAQLAKISNYSNITDIIVCDDVVYQTLLNGSVLAKGYKPSLLGNTSQYEFTEINITNPKQLYCYKDQLWYITSKGEVFKESLDAKNQTIYILGITNAMPTSGVRQIVGDEILQFVLTIDKILVKGTASVKSIYCDTPVNITTTLIKVPLTLNVSEIERLEITRNRDYLFIYMKNGDIFALGDNTNGILASKDTVCERKIGVNISKAGIGWNHTLKQMCAYYILNKNLYIYDSKLTNSYVLVLSTVNNFMMYDYIMSGEYTVFNILAIQNDTIIDFTYQGKLMDSGVDYYCKMNQTDPQCTSYKVGYFPDCYVNDSLILSEPFCNVFNCYLPIPDPTTGQSQNNCTVSFCADQNYTCKAVNCIKAAQKSILVPECSDYMGTREYKMQFTNVKDYTFVNGLLMQFRESEIIVEPTAVKKVLNIWIIIGAVCGGTILVLILTISICVCKKRQNKKQRAIQVIRPIKPLQKDKTVQPLLKNKTVQKGTAKTRTKMVSLTNEGNKLLQ